MKSIARLLFILTAAGLVFGPILAAAPVQAAALHVTAPVAPHAALPDALSLLALVGAAGMAIRIKDTGALAKKFVQRASAAGGDYTSGVQSAGSDWEQNTKASEENYKAGVTQAAADGRFGKGVAAAGAGKYVQRASTLGAQRFPSGVAASEGDWAKGVQPHLDAMKSLNLPPRRPKGDPGNQERARIVADRNRAIRLGK